MLKKFTKMHGVGNDYIYFNCLQEDFVEEVIAATIRLSNRHTGIGADGVVCICKSTVADAKMRMFNADGSEGKMCGNAIRCVAKYLYDNKLVQKRHLTIETLSGIKRLTVFVNALQKVESVKVDMGQADFLVKNIPVALDVEKMIDYPLKIEGTEYKVTCLSVGNPHCVVFTDPNKIDIAKVGIQFENHALFPERVNTEFAMQVDKTTFAMRVWERGSGETMACGTGACAVVAAAIANKMVQTDEEILVKLLGGNLKILIEGKTGKIYMTGCAVTVFEGEVEV